MSVSVYGLDLFAAGSYVAPTTPPTPPDPCSCDHGDGWSKGATLARRSVGVVDITLSQAVAANRFSGVVTPTGLAGGYTFAISGPDSDGCDGSLVTVSTFLNGAPADVGFNFQFVKAS